MTYDPGAAARKAMLSRLATDLSIMAHADKLDWTCCHQTYEYRHRHPDGTYSPAQTWGWRFCNGGSIVFGPSFSWAKPCGHWHHQHEPPAMA